MIHFPLSEPHHSWMSKSTYPMQARRPFFFPHRITMVVSSLSKSSSWHNQITQFWEMMLLGPSTVNAFFTSSVSPSGYPKPSVNLLIMEKLLIFHSHVHPKRVYYTYNIRLFGTAPSKALVRLSISVCSILQSVAVMISWMFCWYSVCPLLCLYISVLYDATYHRVRDLQMQCRKEDESIVYGHNSDTCRLTVFIDIQPWGCFKSTVHS